ncbi:hypothetical protein NPIL_202211 [Nephila pilipes]|uniref:Uncharacterized protein n=1 Tax=Nephila pilipes TaxID=299642 RepID=A0A8X6QMC3_NEPPI|nr:hypothetical protein NPIL_202211 [Nephila pilipes]
MKLNQLLKEQVDAHIEKAIQELNLNNSFFDNWIHQFPVSWKIFLRIRPYILLFFVCLWASFEKCPAPERISYSFTQWRKYEGLYRTEVMEKL